MKLIFGLVFILFGVNNLFSQNTISIQDTTILRAIKYKIPIYGKIQESLDSRLDFCMKFNSMVIDIKDVIVDGTTICSRINNFDTKFNSFVDSEILIKVENIKNNNNGILFYLVVEGLAGADTTTLIEPNCFAINDISSDKIVYENGRINVRSTPVDIDFKEGLGNNSPNPFYDETKVPFTIESSTKVSFKIFSLNGKKVLNNIFENSGFDYEVLNNEGTIITDPENHTFDKGKYQLILRTESWKASAGSYYLIMTTANSSHKTNLMLIK